MYRLCVCELTESFPARRLLKRCEKTAHNHIFHIGEHSNKYRDLTDDTEPDAEKVDDYKHGMYPQVTEKIESMIENDYI